MTNSQRRANSFPSRRRAIAVAISTVLVGAHGVNAQIEEIVVTATKREANLQDIAVAVTAFTSADIQRRRFEGLDDYANFIPSLSFGSREPGGTSVVFRGVAASGIQYGTNPSSGVYLDEQPITAAGINPDPRLIDIERVEAVSGPQGTLFGDASQSGTLRIITNKPDASEFESWIDVSGSKVDEGDFGYDVSAMANIPLVKDTLALRLVGFRSEEAGYIDNVLGTSPGGTFTNANRVSDDVNTVEYTGGRVALRWLVNDKWTVDATAIFQDVQADDGFGDVNFGGRDLEQVRFQPESMDEDWYQLALTVQGETPFGDLLVTGSFFDRDFRYDADATAYMAAFQQISDIYEANFNSYYGTAYDFGFYDFGGDPNGFAFNEFSTKRYTVEARLATPSDSDSRWQGLIGFFYNKTESKALFKSGNEDFAGSPAFYYLAYNPLNLSANGLPPGSFAFTDNWFFGAYDTDVEQVALFGEMSFELTENVTVTAGGRWFEVDRKFDLFQGALTQAEQPDRLTDFVTTDESATETEDGFVPKINVTYRFDDDKLMYFTYSEGFRSGGSNPVRPASLLPRGYDSDKLINYEWGAKTEWLDNRLQFNFTGYVMKWKDIQVQLEDPQVAVFSTGIVNFPEAEVRGFEASFNWLPADGWDLAGSLGYNDATISQDATLFPTSVAPIVVTDGDRLPLTPDWKASFSLQYTFQMEVFGAQPYARIDIAHIGESINTLEGIEPTVVSPPPTIQHAYTTGDLKFGLESARWSASVFLDNAWDERGEQFISNRWAERRTSVNRPRTFGVTFRKYFGGGGD